MDNLQITEYENIRVLTTQQIAEAYILLPSMLDRTHRLLRMIKNSNAGQNGWRRIQKRSVEALEMLRMRMKE